MKHVWLIIVLCFVMVVLEFRRNKFESFKPVLRIRIRLDPFHFGQPDPGSKKSAKIMENFNKN